MIIIAMEIEKTKCVNCGYEYPIISTYCHLCGWQRRLTEEEKNLMNREIK